MSTNNFNMHLEADRKDNSTFPETVVCRSECSITCMPQHWHMHKDFEYKRTHIVTHIHKTHILQVHGFFLSEYQHYCLTSTLSQGVIYLAGINRWEHSSPPRSQIVDDSVFSNNRSCSAHTTCQDETFSGEPWVLTENRFIMRDNKKQDVPFSSITVFRICAGHCKLISSTTGEWMNILWYILCCNELNAFLQSDTNLH